MATRQPAVLEQVNQLLPALMREFGVAMPDGHGVRFADLRKKPADPFRPRCDAYLCAPAPEARAFIGLAMLGMRDPDDPERLRSFFGEGAERWFARGFLRHQADWYERRIVDLSRLGRHAQARSMFQLSEALPRRRWRSMLGALAALAEGCPGLDPARLAEMRDDEWLHHAEVRLAGLVEQWRGVIPPALAPARGRRLKPKDPRWQAASRLLAGAAGTAPDDVALAHAMYFMHLFHACAGLWQVELTDGVAWENTRWKRRSAFYQSLLGLLRCSCSQEPLRQVADHVLGALERLPLFRRDPEAALAMHVERLEAALPPCFGPYLGEAAPYIVDSQAQATEPAAMQAIGALHQLAEMFADQLMDPLRVRPLRGRVPGFCRDDYVYADSRARYGRWDKTQVAVATIKANRGPPDDDETIEVAQQLATEEYRKDMAAYFANVKLARIESMVELNLPAAASTVWRDNGGLPRPCAMCQIRPH